MTDFIKKIYFGRLEPLDRVIEGGEDIANQLELMETNERYLLEHLDGQQKESFIAYLGAAETVNSDNEVDRFCAGFRYGARFMLDALMD